MASNAPKRTATFKEINSGSVIEEEEEDDASTDG